MSALEWLTWLRGSGLQAALALFVLGMVYRLLHPLLLGRAPMLAEARGAAWRGALRTIVLRSFTLPHDTPRSRFTFIAGYLFHLGFLIALFFLAQHIALFQSLLGFAWPALPRGAIDLAAALALAALLALLLHRIVDPVKRLLPTFGDYLAWLLSFLPLATGFLLLRGGTFDYTTLLAWHLASVELLLIAAPFTKLAHMFTTFLARGYNGAILGFKGIPF